jgi:hypothetical protein
MNAGGLLGKLSGFSFVASYFPFGSKTKQRARVNQHPPSAPVGRSVRRMSCVFSSGCSLCVNQHFTLFVGRFFSIMTSSHVTNLLTYTWRYQPTSYLFSLFLVKHLSLDKACISFMLNLNFSTKPLWLLD